MSPSNSQANTMASTSPLAFVGLGAMGHAMSLTLLRQGFPLNVYDISDAAVSKFRTAASEITPEIPSELIRVASSPAAAAQSTNLILLMVANQSHVESALLAPETGAIHTLPHGAVILVTATVSPTYIIELRSRLDDPNSINRPDLVLIDAPVSGGAARSATGTLTIMASSQKPADLEDPRVMNILNALSDSGKNLYLISGGLGGGLKLKALNQVNCGINITSASEIMGCVAVLGLDTRQFYDSVIADRGGKKREGWTWMLENRGPRMLSPDPPMASATAIIFKDVGIILDEARRLGCHLPMLGVAAGVLGNVMKAGMAADDDSCVVRQYLGPDRANLVVANADHGHVSKSEQDELTAQLCTAHACIQLLGAYETGRFAQALGLVEAHQVTQWIEILSGAAGGSPVFDAAMDAVYSSSSSSHHSHHAQKSFDERFKAFTRGATRGGEGGGGGGGGFDASQKLATLRSVIESTEKKGYDVPLLKEASRWISQEI